MNSNNLAVLKLRQLACELSGELILISSKKFSSIKDLSRISKAPFTDDALAIDYNKKHIYYSDQSNWTAIIHEMAHVFASDKLPYASDEWSFLGWEYATVKHIKMPLYLWYKDMSSYLIDKDETTFGSLSSYKKRKILYERFAFAIRQKLISKSGKPKSIR